MPTFIDIAHAVPFTFENSDGAVNLSILDYTVTGPQKALQSLIVMLLSDNLNLKSSSSFLQILRRNNVRDLATLANKYARLFNEILPHIDDPLRPDEERISSSSLISYSSISPDSAIITLDITSRAKQTFKYHIPVRI